MNKEKIKEEVFKDKIVMHQKTFATERAIELAVSLARKDERRRILNVLQTKAENFKELGEISTSALDLIKTTKEETRKEMIEEIEKSEILHLGYLNVRRKWENLKKGSEKQLTNTLFKAVESADETVGEAQNSCSEKSKEKRS